MSRRIGLLTLPLHTNYGGILQAAALYRVLSKDLRHKVIFLERGQRKWPTSIVHQALIGLLVRLPWLPALRNRLSASDAEKSTAFKWIPSGAKRKLLKKADVALREQRMKTHQPFLQRFLPERTGHLGSSQEMSDAAQRFGLDTLIAGSDQVWRLDYFPSNAEEDYFFGFAPNADLRKIAYSASFGHGSWTFPEHTERTKELMAKFHAVSVREASGAEICSTVFGRHDAQHVLDPTMLVDPVFYDEIAGHCPRQDGKTFLSYVLDEGPDRKAFACDVRSALGADYFYRSLTLDAGSKTIGIPEWVRAFMDADFVLTDSFHGMVFSIIFEKRFLAIINRNRGADRFVSLLSQLDLMGRLVSDAKAENVENLVQQPIDYAHVKSRLKELQTVSADFLRKALD